MPYWSPFLKSSVDSVFLLITDCEKLPYLQGKNENNNRKTLILPLIFSLLLHSIVFTFLLYDAKLPEKTNYVKAELWSSLPPESLPEGNKSTQSSKQRKSST